ncbi:hypothetical protein DFH09DRAFT_1109057 [Mycena vulgaris]|nr:hypothetical protein DFH09DRAFT_1109057 [Mycena vulgaris]
MDTQNLASLLLQLLAGNTQPLLAAAAAGQASHPPAANTPAVLAAPPPQTLPPASIHPSPAPQPLATTQIQPYQSLQAAPSVLLPPLPPLSSSSASTNLSSVVNQTRLSDSASSLPQQPALTRRHPCTTAVAPPSLPRAPNISSCPTTVVRLDALAAFGLRADYTCQPSICTYIPLCTRITTGIDLGMAWDTISSAVGGSARLPIHFWVSPGIQRAEVSYISHPSLAGFGIPRAREKPSPHGLLRAYTRKLWALLHRANLLGT